jgi:hypothetical protein
VEIGAMEKEGIHKSGTEDSNQHEFLARAEVELEKLGDRDQHDVDVDGDVICRCDEPEYRLVDAFGVWGFRGPGCPGAWGMVRQ